MLHRSTRPADLVASFNPKILYFLELLEFRIFPKLSRGEIKTKQASIVASLVDVGFLKFDVGDSFTRLTSSLAPFDPKSKRFFA